MQTYLSCSRTQFSKTTDIPIPIVIPKGQLPLPASVPEIPLYTTSLLAALGYTTLLRIIHIFQSDY